MYTDVLCKCANSYKKIKMIKNKIRNSKPKFEGEVPKQYSVGKEHMYAVEYDTPSKHHKIHI